MPMIETYVERYGKFRLDRIMEVGEHFLTCGDYLRGVARMRCTNPDCGLVGASHLVDHASGDLIIFGRS